MHTAFSSGNLNGRDHSEDLGVEGMELREIWWKAVDWIHVA
jgi:hypothetical protein